MKIFVFTNVALSKDSSDGRTLFNLINQKYPNAKIMNFYMNDSFSNQLPKEIKYFHISNSDVYKNAKSLHFHNRVFKQNNLNTSKEENKKPVVKNATNMILRNILWKSQKWVFKELTAKIKEFEPNYLLIQMGDFAYFFDLVRKLSSKLNVPIITFNSETYALKKFDYMKQTTNQSMMYRFFRKKLFKAERKLYLKSSTNYVLSDDIRFLLSKNFSLKDIETFVPQSELTKINPCKHKGINIVYAGNICVGRDQSLIELANSLNNVDDSLKITVYGSCDDLVKEKLINCNAIVYKGIVPYDDLVKTVYPQADLLLHVESFDSYYRKDIQYAFSTKIVDCLATDLPFFCYAPNEISGIRYVKDKLGSDFVSEELKDATTKIVNILKKSKKLN